MNRPLRLSLVLLLGASFACALPGVSTFEVTGGEVDRSCTGLLDFCVRGTCTVKNLGDQAAPATVTFQLHEPDGTTVTAEEYVMLQPKEARPVSHDFAEAKRKDAKGLTVTCTAAAAR